MNLRTYRYGESVGLPGLSIGVTRLVPRGVKAADHARHGYFDVWLPLLAPSRALVMAYRRGKMAFPVFARRYRSEMKTPEAREVIRLVAAMAQRQRVNLGCFCRDESTCHRSVLRKLVEAAEGELPPQGSGASARYASPACSMPEIEG